MTKSYRRLNMLMAKPLGDGETVADLLSDIPVDGYELQEGSGLSGALYVKRSIEKRPLWGPLLDEIAGAPVSGLTNRSSSAVLLLRVDGDVFAFVFGYGRYLLELSKFVQEFGLRTALNTLDDKSLRSVDLHTLEDQPC